MFGKYRTIVIVIVVLAVAFVIYSFFVKGDEGDDLLVSSTAAQTPAAIVSNEIITALNQIESLRLSQEIFNDPVYLNLKDRSQVIPEEPIGKRNPFDPISSNAPASRTTVPQIRDVQTQPAPANTIIRTGGTQPAI